MANFFLLILILFYYFQQSQTQYYPYKHYSRHPPTETIYNNETITENDDENNMCQLSVRCPSIPTLCK